MKNPLLRPNRMLVVDDELDFEILITQRFRKRIRAEERSFLFTGNGEDALAKLQADGLVDVNLTDINMLVMDGLRCYFVCVELIPCCVPS